VTWTPAGLTDRLGGDRRLARELVDIFLSEYPELLRALHDAARRDDPGGMRRAAHALKGSILNFVSDGPADTAALLEQAGTDGRREGVPDLLAQLETELQVLVAAMRRHVVSP